MQFILDIILEHPGKTLALFAAFLFWRSGGEILRGLLKGGMIAVVLKLAVALVVLAIFLIAWEKPKSELAETADEILCNVFGAGRLCDGAEVVKAPEAHAVRRRRCIESKVEKYAAGDGANAKRKCEEHESNLEAWEDCLTTEFDKVPGISGELIDCLSYNHSPQGTLQLFMKDLIRTFTCLLGIDSLCETEP